MSRPCTAHQWSHPTEPCPYCREINSSTGRSAPQSDRAGESTPAPGSNAARAERVSALIAAAVSGDASRIELHFTPDVVGSGPAISVSSRDELRLEIEAREGAFTDIELVFAPLDVSGTQAAVEWVASVVPARPLVADESRIGFPVPAGRRVRVRAVTVAEFDGEQICSFRSYWDDLRLLRDLSEARPG
jgi:ketosteroid isomerase-like protein